MHCYVYTRHSLQRGDVESTNGTPACRYLSLSPSVCLTICCLDGGLVLHVSSRLLLFLYFFRHQALQL